MGLTFTGERFIPGTRGEIWMEHWHRYHFASRWVEGKRVLDIACGEGYGSALLARRARSVLGVDISPESIAHAQKAYAALANASFANGSCDRIPAEDGSIDVAVSFETVEHIREQEPFMAELARVLAPGGVLILSCPNKAEYTDKRGTQNEFHVKELYRDELQALVQKRFPHSAWYGHKPSFYSVIAPEAAVPSAGELIEVKEASPDMGAPKLAAPLYFIVVASRDPAALQALAPALSVMADETDWAYSDWFKVTRENWAYQKRVKELEAGRGAAATLFAWLRSKIAG